MPLSAEKRTSRSATGSPPSSRRFGEADVGAHLDQGLVEAGARRVQPDRRQRHLGSLDEQRRGDRKGGRARVARHRDRLRPQLRLAAQRDRPGPPASSSVAIVAPKPPSIRSVWSRVGSASITTVSPGALSPASSTADFTCAEGIGVVYCTGSGLAAPDQRDRQPPAAPAARLGAEQRQRVGHPPHRPAAQAGVAGEGRGDVGGRHRAHDQPHAGAGVAVVDDVLRLPEAADADALDPPLAGPEPLDRRAEGPHRPAGVDHVLALEQAGDPGLADRQRAEDQRPVRDRLVARHLGASAERPAGRGAHRFRLAMPGHRRPPHPGGLIQDRRGPVHQGPVPRQPGRAAGTNGPVASARGN